MLESGPASRVTSISRELVEVLQLLDNVASHAITSDDSMSPCRRDHGGHHHMDGDVMLAPLSYTVPVPALLNANILRPAV